MRKIAPNVFEFLDKASSLYGNMMNDRFSQQMFSSILDNGNQSPIEDMFLIAAYAMCEAEYIKVNPEAQVLQNGDLSPGRGISIVPQHKIGTYRVDFTLWQDGIAPEEVYTPVVVELDGHDFHDKDKRQRSYEKARDRFLVKMGYRVLHFTGSDVVADPFKVAFEALDMLGAFVGGRDSYDPTDPLGIGC